MAHVATAVKVRIFAHPRPYPVETYKLDSAGDRAAWNANASSYPSMVIETVMTEMTDADAERFNVAATTARKEARSMGLRLRTNKAPTT